MIEAVFDAVAGATEVWCEFVLRALTDGTIGCLLVVGAWLLLRRRASAQFGYLLLAVALAKLAVPVTWSDTSPMPRGSYEPSAAIRVPADCASMPPSVAR